MIVNSFQKCFGNWKVNNNRFSILSEIATDAIYASTAYSGSIGWAFSTTSDINKEKYRIKPVFFSLIFFQMSYFTCSKFSNKIEEVRRRK
jgi:hypothetical protein